MIDKADEINKIYELLNSNKLKEAEILINNLSELNHDNIELLNLKGELFKKLGKYLESKEMFMKVKELSSPNIPIQVFLNLADAHISLKEYDDAEFIYNNIVAMQPNNIATLNGLGRVLVNKMKYQQAINQFNSNSKKDGEKLVGLNEGEEWNELGQIVEREEGFFCFFF